MLFERQTTTSEDVNGELFSCCYDEEESSHTHEPYDREERSSVTPCSPVVHFSKAGPEDIPTNILIVPLQLPDQDSSHPKVVK